MATLDELLALITSEHANKPTFVSVLSAVLQPFVDGQNLIDSVPALYDVDVAVGQQLDVVGQWVGIARELSVPIPSVYFSFDIEHIGFDEGVWWQPGDPFEGVISLDDGTYRSVILAKIKSNQSDGTLASLNGIVEAVLSLSPGCVGFVRDNMDMSIDIFVVGTPPSTLILALLAQGIVPIRPGAVKLNGVWYGGTPFGLDDTDYTAGLDIGIWLRLV